MGVGDVQGPQSGQAEFVTETALTAPTRMQQTLAGGSGVEVIGPRGKELRSTESMGALAETQVFLASPGPPRAAMG